MPSHTCVSTAGDPQLTDQEAEDLWQKYHAAVEALPARAVQAPKRLPIPPAAAAWVRQFLARHRGPEVLDVINVDPRELVIYQFYVAVDRSDHHAKSLAQNHGAKPRFKSTGQWHSFQCGWRAT